MGSGAYSVFIDAPPGTAGSTTGRRVVPLPPTDNSGGVKFTDVYLSLAYDDFGGPQTSPATVEIRILKAGGQVQTIHSQNLIVGRTVVHHVQVGDLAAGIITTAAAVPSGQPQRVPAVTALVEYTTP